jgi:hypothetical protein
MATLTVTASVAGSVQKSGVTTDWATLRAYTSGNYTATNTGERLCSLQSDGSNFTWLYRGFLVFDTSALTAAATITSAIVKVYGASKANNLGSTPLHLAGATIGNTSALGNDDYDQIARTSFGSIDHATFDGNGWNTFASSAGLIANINKTGKTQFSLQLGWDIDNSAPSHGVGSQTSTYAIDFADISGKEPTLEVTYELASNKLYMMI